MTDPLFLAFVVPAGTLVALLAMGWYGSSVIFHPPNPAPNLKGPDAFGLEFSEISFRTADGLRLAAWWIPARKAPGKNSSRGCIIVVHGWGDNKSFVLPHSEFLARKEGYDLLLFDCRSMGESEGKNGSIGFLESRDFDAAFAWLRENHPEALKNLGVFGSSMGGVVAIHAAARLPEIRCAFILNTYTSFVRVVRQWTWNSFHLPYYPFVWITLKVTAWRLGGDSEPYSPIYHIDKISPRPVMIVHGDADRLMPLQEAHDLMEKAKEPKTLWIVPGAQHGKCWETDPPEFERRAASFFNGYLGKTR